MPNGRKKVKLPRGYRVYRAIHRFRYPRVTTLTPKAYRYAPIRAFETALGIRPRKWIRQIKGRQRAERSILNRLRRR